MALPPPPPTPMTFIRASPPVVSVRSVLRLMIDTTGQAAPMLAYVVQQAALLLTSCKSGYISGDLYQMWMSRPHSSGTHWAVGAIQHNTELGCTRIMLQQPSMSAWLRVGYRQAHLQPQTRCCCMMLMLSTLICGRPACSACHSAVAASWLLLARLLRSKQSVSSLSGPPSLAPRMALSPSPVAGEQATCLSCECGNARSTVRLLWGSAAAHASRHSALRLKHSKQSRILKLQGSSTQRWPTIKAKAVYSALRT